MSAELLRRAATQMRERAEAAVLVTGEGPWPFTGPLAVADWLDLRARLLDEGWDANAETAAAVVVARAYLGEQP